MFITDQIEDDVLYLLNDGFLMQYEEVVEDHQLDVTKNFDSSVPRVQLRHLENTKHKINL